MRTTKLLASGERNMKNYRVTLTIEGDPKEHGDVRLDTFISELARFADVARKAEEVISDKDKQHSIYYRVVNLRRSSPARVTLEACAKDPSYDVREAVHTEIAQTMKRLSTGEEIKGRERFYLIESIRNFVDPIGKKVSTLNVSFDRKIIRLDEKFKARADIYVAPEEIGRSYFTGMLDAINIHGPNRMFYMYPLVGPNKIQCIFPDRLLGGAKKSLGERVKVTGQFRYKLNAPYPHSAEVETIEPFPPEGELPSFIDLFGVEPDLTNGLPSVEYVRRIRDAQ